MGQVYAQIDQKLRAWLSGQPVFFVGTAPAGGEGHVNVSPKGMSGTFVVLDEHRVAYLDYFGSGIETIAHLRQNGRIVLMFCAFNGPPKIVRLHGRGTAVFPDQPEFDDLWARFAGEAPTGRPVRRHGLRAIIVAELSRISDSCGFGVPLMDHVGDRDLLTQWQERRTADDLAGYAAQKNATSVDGLPGLAPVTPAVSAS